MTAPDIREVPEGGAVEPETPPRWMRPEHEEPVPGETTMERSRRVVRNRRRDEAARRYNAERCVLCGQTRSNVIHETDREHAPEGLAYYADVPFCPFEPAEAPR